MWTGLPAPSPRGCPVGAQEQLQNPVSDLAPGEVNATEWGCPRPGCGNVVLKKRSKCPKCGELRPEDLDRRPMKKGSSMPIMHFVNDKGACLEPEIFRSENWKCPGCANINWDWREKCNWCQNPRPGIEGQRTGNKGGYCDRDDNIERNQHNSDDEEIDDFGRKKKKSNSAASKQAEALKRLYGKKKSNRDSRSRSPRRR